MFSRSLSRSLPHRSWAYGYTASCGLLLQNDTLNQQRGLWQTQESPGIILIRFVQVSMCIINHPKSMQDITEDCQSGSCDLLGFRQHLGQPRQGPMTATLLLTLYTVAKVPFIRDKLRPSQLSSSCSSEEATRSLPLLSINYSAVCVCPITAVGSHPPPRSLSHRIITNVP